MPYIKRADRSKYDGELSVLCSSLEDNGFIDGHVTYILWTIIVRWFKFHPKYTTICSIRGALSGTMTEFNRRFADPYEDDKIKENGDAIGYRGEWS